MEIIDHLIEAKNFNLFLGAGISKKAPSYAPIWRELLNNFIKGLYKKLEPEHWPALANCQDHIDKLTQFNFRPETFWEFCQVYLSADTIIKFLSVLDIGSPNTNHMLFSYLLFNGYVRNIITTNFDQYIEQCCPGCDVIRSDVQISHLLAGNKSTIRGKVIKIHGCLKEPNSLQFNLKQTANLSPYKQELLHKTLLGSSLLICGYSGYDDDILPVLRKIIPSMEKVVILSYPGSDKNEPVQKLSNEFKNVSIVEVDINEAILEWIIKSQKKSQSRFIPEWLVCNKHKSRHKTIEKWIAKNGFKFAKKEETVQDIQHKCDEINRHSLQDILFPEIPFFLSKLYNFAGFTKHANSYAILADDAREDRRYAATVSKELEYQIYLNLQNTFSKSEHPTILPPHFYHNKLKESGLVKDSWEKTIEVNVDYALNLIINKENCNEREMQQAKHHLEAAYTLFKSGVINGSFCFKICWAMGRLKSSQAQYAEAIQLYNEGMTCVNDLSMLDKVTGSSFCLDVATSHYEESVKNLDDNLLRQAYELYEVSRQLAENINDYDNLTKSLKGLAMIELYSMEFEKSREHILQAEETCKRTGNSRLQERISQTKDFIFKSTSI